MRLFLRQRRPTPGEPGIAGTVRVDPRTKSLTKRLRPGDIAVIDHLDLDRVSAEALAACRPAAVLNAARSTSGRNRLVRLLVLGSTRTVPAIPGSPGVGRRWRRNSLIGRHRPTTERSRSSAAC